MILYLSQHELAALFRQAPSTRGDGGWQSLLVKLQKQTSKKTGRIYLIPRDIERIARYAFKYGHGGWENCLMGIFSRTLGLKLTGQVPVSYDRLKIAA